MKNNHNTYLVVILISAFLLSTLFFGINIQNTVAKKPTTNWWNQDWSYSRAIQFTEISGNSLVNFPVQVTFEHDGKTKELGEDIRIVIDNIEVPSCVSKIDSIYATVVFEINLEVSTSKTAYIYYGNPDASNPTYPLTPLTLSSGETGYAIIDNSVYIGWANTVWAGTGSPVTIWVDYKIDFDENNNPTDDYDMITDDGWRGGGIGRLGWHFNHNGLGSYQECIQTPIYVDIVFANAYLRVYKNNDWVETIQADELWMFGTSYDYAKISAGLEQNIIDGLDKQQQTPDPYYEATWNELYLSTTNPGYMAFRDDTASIIFAVTGVGISQDYKYWIGAKEAPDWDRKISFDYNENLFPWEDKPMDPYDQPTECRIYWYSDNSNTYSQIESMSQIFNSQPSSLIGAEQVHGKANAKPQQEGFIDNFSGKLKSEWVFVDPDGGSTIDLSCNRGCLRITTTQPPYRDLYIPVDTNAPRILIQEQTGDFSIETKVFANTDQEWESGGILIWKDESNFVRLDRACGMSNSQRILYAITQNGVSWTDVTDVILPSNLNPTYLRIMRSGNVFSAYYGSDGKDWIHIDDKTFSASEPVSVGLDVVNVYHDERTFYADFDYFKLTTNP